MGAADTVRKPYGTLQGMADIQKRGSHTPRHARERRAYQLVVVGGVAGLVGVVGIVLAAIGTVGAGLPIVALIVAAICVLIFRRQVGR
jgi:lipopolysaccharide export LptBFGC system permease protein LptF